MKNRSILAITERGLVLRLGLGLGICLLATACAPTGVSNSSGGSGSSSDRGQAVVWSEVPEVVNMANDMREVMKAKIGSSEVVAVLQWRAYNGRRDALQTTWYGDMKSPPPTYVVESLLISVDGRGLMVPAAQTRYLCSQWMNNTPRLGLYLKGEDLCIYITLGDGSDAWCASYIVNLESGALISHQVESQRAFHRAVKRSM